MTWMPFRTLMVEYINKRIFFLAFTVTTMRRAEQLEDEPRRRRRRHLRDSHESAAGRPEQLVDVGRSDPELRGLNDYASTGSGLTH